MNRNSSDLIIIRHARSEYNVGLTSNLDSSITDFGIQQAELVGRYLADGHFGDLSGYTFYTSPFLRCLMTTDYIQKQLPCKVCIKVHPLLGEYLHPDYEPVEIRPNPLYEHFNWWDFSSGSTFEDLKSRFYKAEVSEHFLGRMHKAYDSLDEKSVVITHGLPALVLGLEAQSPIAYLPMWDHSINNCSITWIKNGRKRWWGRNLHHEVNYQDRKEYKTTLT